LGRGNEGYRAKGPATAFRAKRKPEGDHERPKPKEAEGQREGAKRKGAVRPCEALARRRRNEAHASDGRKRGERETTARAGARGARRRTDETPKREPRKKSPVGFFSGRPSEARVPWRKARIPKSFLLPLGKGWRMPSKKQGVSDTAPNLFGGG
jgi:hypothetical protein